MALKEVLVLAFAVIVLSNGSHSIDKLEDKEEPHHSPRRLEPYAIPYAPLSRNKSYLKWLERVSSLSLEERKAEKYERIRRRMYCGKYIR